MTRPDKNPWTVWKDAQNPGKWLVITPESTIRCRVDSYAFAKEIAEECNAGRRNEMAAQLRKKSEESKYANRYAKS